MSTEGEGMGIVCLGRGSLIWNPGVLLAPCAVALALAGPAHAQAGCADWNTGDYFEAATVADVERCLAAGADIEARNEGGMTPLHWAADYGTAETVTALLAAGADPRARDESGATPLHFAAYFGNAETVTALLAAGADPRARDESGWTPLHRAARYGTAETVTALLAAGADPRARDESGEIPFDKAEPNERLKGTDAWWRLNDARFD